MKEKNPGRRMGKLSANIWYRLPLYAAAGFSSFTHFGDILEAIGGNVKTDITFDQMKNIAKNYRSARHHVKTYEVKGNGTKIDGIYYLQVNDSEQEKVHEMIQAQL